MDEIRNISDPNKYFKYFITKNERWNDRQRFAMNRTHLPAFLQITSPNLHTNYNLSTNSAQKQSSPSSTSASQS